MIVNPIKLFKVYGVKVSGELSIIYFLEIENKAPLYHSRSLEKKYDIIINIIMRDNTPPHLVL